jgi:hypothetical protein
MKNDHFWDEKSSQLLKQSTAVFVLRSARLTFTAHTDVDKTANNITRSHPRLW